MSHHRLLRLAIAQIYC